MKKTFFAVTHKKLKQKEMNECNQIQNNKQLKKYSILISSRKLNPM